MTTLWSRQKRAVDLIPLSCKKSAGKFDILIYVLFFIRVDSRDYKLLTRFVPSSLPDTQLPFRLYELHHRNIKHFLYFHITLRAFNSYFHQWLANEWREATLKRCQNIFFFFFFKQSFIYSNNVQALKNESPWNAFCDWSHTIFVDVTEFFLNQAGRCKFFKKTTKRLRLFLSV